jgi:acyl-CoA synthetase (AMP-forming)/AMP-acid ligase II
MDRAAADPGREAVVHWRAGAEPWRWGWGELLTAAEGHARRCWSEGIREGDVAALILRHHSEFHALYMGLVAIGAVPTVLAYPNERLHPEKFRDGLRGIAARSGLDWVLTEEALDPLLRPLLGGGASATKGIVFPFRPAPASTPAARQNRGMVNADRIALLQHSSGTTGLQKGVALTHEDVLGHVERYGAAIAATPSDRIVSWLPLYHDMGLIAAFHLPLALGIPVVQLDPFEWVQAPILLLEAISRESGTLTWLPNFAYNHMAAAVRDDDLEGIGLKSLRLVVNCSEPVRQSSHDRFRRRFERSGLRPETLGACYAMAETTFAVTQTAPGAPARALSVDAEAFALGRIEMARPPNSERQVTSSGRAIDGCRLRIVGSDGHDLPDDRVGEIAVESESLFSGYRNAPRETEAVLRDGWYFTGDEGFRHEGEYYVVGRRKDVIIVAGRNIYPEDVEDAVSAVAGVAPGRVVAFGIDDEDLGTQNVAVIVEPSMSPPVDEQALRAAVARAAAAVDVTIHPRHVYVVPPRWLIKSSAGKPSRSANRKRILETGR